MEKDIPPDRQENPLPEETDREEDSTAIQIVTSDIVPSKKTDELKDKAQSFNEAENMNVSKALFTETQEPVSFINQSITSTVQVVQTPKKPINSRTTTPTKRDYKTLYEDVKSRFVKY